MAHRMSHMVAKLAVLVLFFTISAQAQTRKAIQVSLSANGGVNQADASFTSIESAIDSLQKDLEGTYGPAFAVADNYQATFDILGFELNFDMTIPPGGLDPATLTVSFLGADGNVVVQEFSDRSVVVIYNEVEDFLESKQGKEWFAEYMVALQKNAIFNFVTGPESSVGESVRSNTMRAIGATRAPGEDQSGARGGQFSIGAQWTEFQTELFAGETYTVPISMGGRLGERFTLDFHLPLSYTNLEGTEFYRAGTELDLGIRMTGLTSKSPIEWVVTPTVGNYLMGSVDLLTGGDVFNYGIQNRVSYTQSGFMVSYGLYYGFYESLKVKLGEVPVDYNVDEKVLSQGIRVAYSLSRMMFVDVYGLSSKPQEGEGYSAVQTVGGSLNFGGKGAIFSVGYSKDEGIESNNGYKATRWSGMLSFRW